MERPSFDGPCPNELPSFQKPSSNPLTSELDFAGLGFLAETKLQLSSPLKPRHCSWRHNHGLSSALGQEATAYSIDESDKKDGLRVPAMQSDPD